MYGTCCFKNTCLWFLLTAIVLLSLLPSVKTLAQEPVKTIVIVDGSRSMWQRIYRKRKYRTVISGLNRILKSPPNANPIGIMTFGTKKRRSCKDIGTLKSVSEEITDQDLKNLKRFRPRGRAPISLAMQRAAQELDHENNAVRIVLIVDGYDNCRQDPCDTLKELRRTAYDMSVQLVGYGLRKKDIKHYQCFAEHKSDAFYSTGSPDEFLTALFIALGGQHNDISQNNYKPPAVNEKQIKSLLKGTSRVKLLAILAKGTPLLREGVSWKIYKALNDSSFRGLPVAVSNQAQPIITLKPGNYVAEARYGDAKAEQAILVPVSGLLSHVVNLNAGQLQVDTKERVGGERLEGVFYSVYEIDEKSNPSEKPIARSTRSVSRFFLREGNYLLKAKHGGNQIAKTTSVEPGGLTTLTLLMNIGKLKLKTIPSRNSAPLTRIFYSVYKTNNDSNTNDSNTEDIDNLNEAMRTAAAQPTLRLPAGKYIVKAEHDLAHAYQEVEVRSGETIDITINLKASILKLQSYIKGQKKPLQKQISYLIQRLKKGKINNAVEIARTSEAEKSYILSPGKYRITGRYGTINAVREINATLSPGAKKTVSVIHSAGQVEMSLIDKKGGFPRIDVFWLIYNKDGQEIWRTSRPTPELILRSGKYKAVAESNDQRYEKAFIVKNGKKTEISLKTKD